MKNFNKAFSLMEMMVVLLIVAIVAAASAPMVNKRLTARSTDGSCLWEEAADALFYEENRPVVIGAHDSHNISTKLMIESEDGKSDIAIHNSDGNTLNIRTEYDSVLMTSLSSSQSDSSVVIGWDSDDQGMGVVVGAGSHAGTDAVAIGYNSGSREMYSVNVGADTTNNGEGAVSIGYASTGNGTNAVAIGLQTQAGDYGIAIGGKAANDTITTAVGNGIAIGSGTSALGTNSIAIGNGVIANTEHQIRIGGANDTVVIDGDLHFTYYNTSICMTQLINLLRLHNVLTANDLSLHAGHRGFSSAADPDGLIESDRRLKNVGEKFTGGLEELKKLDLYNYTYKKDDAKTPHVGIMAQDLMKIYPNAVVKGEDGYYRIRMEEMFYSVINAVKELDNKITEIAAQVKGILEDIVFVKSEIKELKTLVETQQQTIETQQKAIEAQMKMIEEQKKAIEELKA